MTAKGMFSSKNLISNKSKIHEQINSKMISNFETGLDQNGNGNFERVQNPRKSTYGTDFKKDVIFKRNSRIVNQPPGK